MIMYVKSMKINIDLLNFLYISKKFCAMLLKILEKELLADLYISKK